MFKLITSYFAVYIVLDWLILKYLLLLFQEKPDWALAAIIQHEVDEFKYKISYKKAWMVWTKAIEILFDGWDESYMKLPKYMHALQTYNPRTIILDIAIFLVCFLVIQATSN